METTTSDPLPDERSLNFAVPSVLLFPQGHNLTTVFPVNVGSTDATILRTSFLTAGVHENENLDWLLLNPVFKIWHTAPLTNIKNLLPTDIKTVPYSSIQSLQLYYACLGSFLRVTADWLKTVNSDSTIYDSILAHPKSTVAAVFPVYPAIITIALAHLDAPHLVDELSPSVLDFNDTPHTQPVLQLSPTSSTRGSPVPLLSLRIASPNDYIASSPYLRKYNEKSKHTWTLFGIIDHSGRVRDLADTPHPLQTSLQDLNFWSDNQLSNI